MPKMPSSIDRGVTRLSLRLCPHCGYAFDTVGTHDGSDGAPEPGDGGICINCTEIMVFEAGTVRKLTAEEQAAYADESDNEWEELRRARARLRYLRRRGLQAEPAKRGSGRRN